MTVRIDTSSQDLSCGNIPLRNVLNNLIIWSVEVNFLHPVSCTTGEGEEGGREGGVMGG